MHSVVIMNSLALTQFFRQELTMIKMLSQKMPQTWCLYWVPFQWLFTNLKKAFFVDLKDVPKPERKRVSSEGSLFDSKYEYLHVVEEVPAFYWTVCILASRKLIKKFLLSADV